MFLFIFESIGTSELILIGVIALIFLGPRKLPQIARTIGKTMAEFRSSANEFKSTWEREVDMEEEARALRNFDEPTPRRDPVPREDSIGKAETVALPSIKPVDVAQFENAPVSEPAPPVGEDEPQGDRAADKRSWL